MVVWTLLLAAAWGAAQGPSTTPATLPTADQIKLVQKSLEILKSPKNPLDTRKTMAGVLMDNMEVPQAYEGLAKVLADPKDRQGRLAVMEAIAERVNPDRRFIGPLIELLLTGDMELQRSAAGAIGRYRDRKLTAELREIAAGPKRPLAQRLAAIQALGKMHVKDNVRILIDLMKASQKDKPARREITLACAEGLRELTRFDYRTNIEAWEQYWQENRSKTAEQWLEAQLSLLDNTLTRKLELTEKALVNTTTKLILASKNEADRTKAIQTYLTGELLPFRLAAIGVLSNLLVQNKDLPEELRKTVRERIFDTNPQIRQKCAYILRESNDAKAVPNMLKQLDKEDEPTVKRELLIALGQLGQPQPELLNKIIQHLTSPLEPVAIGAADAIGRVFRTHKGKVPGPVKDQAVAAVLKRYQTSEEQQTQLKQQLLAGMAIITDVRFLPEFKRALAGTNPDLRRGGVEGLRQLRDPKQVNLLLEHIADSDPAVRADIASALAELTDDPSIVQKLVDRINPSVEKDDAVRQFTWNAIIDMIARWPLGKQLKWAEQLLGGNNHLTEDHKKTLTNKLAEQINAQSGSWQAKQKIDAFTTFARLALKTSRPADAIKYLRRAVEAAKPAGDPAAIKIATDAAEHILNMTPNKPSADVAAQFLNGMAGLLNGQQLQTLTDKFVQALQKRSDRTQLLHFINGLSKELRNVLPKTALARLEELRRPKPATKPASTQPAKPGK